MSCTTYALACFMNDKLWVSSQYESAIFALANFFLKSLKKSIFNTKTVFTLLQLDPGVSITFLMDKALLCWTKFPGLFFRI